MGKPKHLIGKGVLAARPASDTNREGALYFQTDSTPGLYRQGVSAWELEVEWAATTVEALQDLVGAMLDDSAELDFSYDDGAGTVTAALVADSVAEEIGRASCRERV
jgi:hypothetical protein